MEEKLTILSKLCWSKSWIDVAEMKLHQPLIQYSLGKKENEPSVTLTEAVSKNVSVCNRTKILKATRFFEVLWYMKSITLTVLSFFKMWYMRSATWTCFIFYRKGKRKMIVENPFPPIMQANVASILWKKLMKTKD